MILEISSYFKQAPDDANDKDFKVTISMQAIALVLCSLPLVLYKKSKSVQEKSKEFPTHPYFMDIGESNESEIHIDITTLTPKERHKKVQLEFEKKKMIQNSPSSFFYSPLSWLSTFRSQINLFHYPLHPISIQIFQSFFVAGICAFGLSFSFFSFQSNLVPHVTQIFSLFCVYIALISVSPVSLMPSSFFFIGGVLLLSYLISFLVQDVILLFD